MIEEPVSAVAPPLSGRVMMNQDWCDLTFLHWAVSPERVAHLMPPGVRPDTHHGVTYVGLIPFRMVDAAPFNGRGTPWLGSFLETNVRLYSIDSTGRRGVVFLSLDIDRSVVVAGARLAFNVPYRWAAMRHEVRRRGAQPEHTYRARLRRGGDPVTSKVVVRVGAPREATPLDEFLSARWGLHTRWLGRTLYIPNTHPTWPLQDAELVEFDDGLMASVGLPELRERQPDHLAFSPGVHTEFGFPSSARRVRSTIPGIPR